MSDERVIVRYAADVQGVGRGSQRAGAEYVVTDVETAQRLHPQAEIVRYADGRPYIVERPSWPRRRLRELTRDGAALGE